MTVTIKVESSLLRLQRRVMESPALMADIMSQWTRMYASYIQRRFNTYSKGGGDWPALALSTIQRRRKGKPSNNPTRSSLARSGGVLVSAGGVYSILVDTGLLKRSLNPELATMGSVTAQANQFSMIARFGGNGKYEQSSATTQQILAFHQVGGGNLPQRRILVQPDYATLKRMHSVAKKMILDKLK